MNTPAHLLFGAALFGNPRHRRSLWAAVAGSLAPDASLYILAGNALFLQKIPAHIVFDQLYFSPTWQAIFMLDNAILLWLGLLGCAIWFQRPLLRVFAAAGSLHVTMDLLVHAGDGRAHFWPFSTWVFHSPVSYWDMSHGAIWVGSVSLLACIAAYVTLWIKGLGWSGRILFGVLLAAEFWVARQWYLYF